MQQLGLDFSGNPEVTPKKTGVTIPVVKTEVWEKVNAITSKKKEKYNFSEEVIINWRTYTFVISSKIKEWVYTFDVEKGRITNITFRLIGADKEYRFTVGISDYTITRSEQKKYNDDSLVGYLETIFISYILKLDADKWWARFANREWQPIMNFDYFKYLFGWKTVHHILMPILKKVVLDIENKRSQSLEK